MCNVGHQQTHRTQTNAISSPHTVGCLYWREWHVYTNVANHLLCQKPNYKYRGLIRISGGQFSWIIGLLLTRMDVFSKMRRFSFRRGNKFVVEE